MAFGRLERRTGARPMSEINMTPLIDVMLVLLVIFIIAAPLMASSLKLDLPRVDSGGESASTDALLVAVDAAGTLYLAEQPVDAALLASRAREVARRRPATEVQLRADSRVPYGRVAEVLALLQQAGLTRIGFVTEAAPQAPAGQ
jgi:biopolymer transport protein TolR